MPKMSIDPMRLGGRTMGTDWAVVLDAPAPDGLQNALQSAVDQVDAQMSTWKTDSDLMRFNAAPLNQWLDLPGPLLLVLAMGLDISRDTDNAFEMNVGAAVQAWGFSAAPIDLAAIRAASAAPRIPAVEALDLAPGQARKTAPVALDLSGIAKGFGVDQLVSVLRDHNITRALCSIDGEVRALGAPQGKPGWPVAIETPDTPDRTAHSILALHDAAVATSGDYRHFVTIRGARLSHTIDPRRSAPLVGAPASVSVLGETCIWADAMATALMVMGADQGLKFAQSRGISALFLTRDGSALRTTGTAPFDTPFT